MNTGIGTVIWLNKLGQGILLVQDPVGRLMPTSTHVSISGCLRRSLSTETPKKTRKFTTCHIMITPSSTGAIPSIRYSPLLPYHPVMMLVQGEHCSYHGQFENLPATTPMLLEDLLKNPFSLSLTYPHMFRSKDLNTHVT